MTSVLGNPVPQFRRPRTTLGEMPDGFWAPASTTIYPLVTTQATFWMVHDSDNLVRLEAFWREGGPTLTNRGRSLWRLTYFDTTATDAEQGLRHIEPGRGDAHQITYDEATASLHVETEVQVAHAVYLRVITHLQAVEDRLEVKTTCEWITSPPGYALDGVSIFPLRIDPRDQPHDVAAFSAIKGMIVRDPIYRFHLRLRDPDQPFAFWGGRATYVSVYPSGKSLSMPLWGYYSESDHEGWMIWAEDDVSDQLRTEYQSDGVGMKWDCYVMQPDWMTDSNGGHPLGSTQTFCLRPFLGTSEHCWWDMANHYRLRLEANPPDWYTPKIRDDVAHRCEPERRANIWLIADYTQFETGLIPTDLGVLNMPTMTEDTQGVDLVDATQALKEATGGDMPLIGFVRPNEDTSQYWLPECPSREGDDIRAGLVDACGDVTGDLQDVYLGMHKAGAITPQCNYRGTYELGSVTDAWRQKEILGGCRTGRQGLLDGDTLLTKHTGGSAGGYHKEIAYTVQSVDSSLRQIQLTAPVAEDWQIGLSWAGTSVAWLDRLGRLASQRLEAINTATGLLTLVSPGGLDADGEIHYPGPGAAVWLAEEFCEECPHAMVGSSLMAWLAKHGRAVFRRNECYGPQYFDVYVSKGTRQETMSCNSAHTGWAPLNAGYVRHPQGGGNWFPLARKELLRAYHEAFRGERNPPMGICVGEYLDQSFFPYMHVGAHAATMIGLWRGMSFGSTGDDPDHHRVTAVPMFSVVHSGRGLGLNWLYQFGNGILSWIARHNTWVPEAYKFRRSYGYLAGHDWPYGLTPTGYTHWAADYLGLHAGMSPFDPGQYLGANAASSEVADITLMWLDIVANEKNWALNFLRNGQLLKPMTLAGGTTTFDAVAYGIWDTVFVAQLGGNVPVCPRADTTEIYEPKTCPRTSHAVWRHHSQEAISLVACNWTDTAGTLAGTITFEEYGLPDEPIHVYEADTNGTLTPVSAAWISHAVNESVSAYSTFGLVFLPESELYWIDAVTVEEDTPEDPDQNDPHTVTLLETHARILIRFENLDISTATEVRITEIRPSGSKTGNLATLYSDGSDGAAWIHWDRHDVIEEGTWGFRLRALIAGVWRQAQVVRVQFSDGIVSE